MEDEHLIEAFNAWEELSQTPETNIAYHSRLKAIVDEEARIHSALHQGKKEQANETAKVLLNNNIPDEIILQSTGLTIEELQFVKDELKK